MAYTAIDDPEAYFQVKLWTGNSTNDRAITFDNTDADLDPDLIWIKKRTDDIEDHAIHDTVRGISSSAKLLNPNGTGLEETHGNNGFVSAVSADTFTLKTNGGDSYAYEYNNTSGDTYVAWCWKESATSGFDIVSYTGDGNADRAISHSLSAKPDLIFNKTRDTTAQQWSVYHSSLGATKHLGLDRTNAEDTGTQYYADTEPTTSVFSVGTEPATNYNTAAIITYLWTEKQGFSKFGKYTGNNNADGPFIFLGFRPAFIMVKQTDGTQSWAIVDTKRNTYNQTSKTLFANNTGVEQDSTANASFDILSNGFKPRMADNDVNGDGTAYIFMAFAEAPFVNSNGVPCNAR